MTWALSKGQVSDTAAAIYTVGSGATARAKSVVFFNTGGSSESVVLYVVNNNGGAVGTAADADKIITFSLDPNGTAEFSPGYPLVGDAQNDTLQAESSTAATVNYFVLGSVV